MVAGVEAKKWYWLGVLFPLVFTPPLFSQYLLEPFLELNDLFENKEFVHEQVVSPPLLRKFFIPPALIRAGQQSSVSWCDRIKVLLDGMAIPSYLHYVSPVYAANTYRVINDMAATVGLESPLIFLADKTQYQSTKTIDSMLLHGNFYALIINQAFIARRTDQQLRALVAKELGAIVGLRKEKGKVFGSLYSIGAALLISYFAYKYCSISWIKEHYRAIGVYSLVLSGGGVIAHLLDAVANKTNELETKAVVLRAFNGQYEEYEYHLSVVGAEELARAQQRELYLYGYIFFLIKQIDSIADLLTPYAACFLRNQLMIFAQSSLQKPAYLKAGFSDAV